MGRSACFEPPPRARACAHHSSCQQHSHFNMAAFLLCCRHCCCFVDGDIYGSEGAYMRYEEGAWEGSDAHDQDVSSGRQRYRSRPASARPAHSYGGYTDDSMDNDDAYATPETTAPLQARQDTPRYENNRRPHGSCSQQLYQCLVNLYASCCHQE